MAVENAWDELWVAVKSQSNQEIARTLRNAFRSSLGHETTRGRATDRIWGSQILLYPDELRMLVVALRE